jgi:serine/threonine protein kinase
MPIPGGYSSGTPTTPPQPSFPFLRPPRAYGDLGFLGGKRILRLIGAGGMGYVFEATDPKLRRQVALKVLPPQISFGDGHKRFLREAQALASVHSRHVVDVYEVGEDNGVHFLVMPLLRGETLAERIKREGPLPVAEVLRIGGEMAQGLAALHERDLVHRDIKPANVWLEAEQGEVILLDLGVVLDCQNERLTIPNGLIGTLPYMAPEQVDGIADRRSDLYSFGVVLYEMSTGVNPFLGATRRDVLDRIFDLQPDPPAELGAPGQLSDLIIGLLAKQPEERRPETVVEVSDCLAELARPNSGWPRLWGRLFWGVATVCLLGLLVAGAVWLLPALRSRSAASSTNPTPPNPPAEVGQPSGPTDTGGRRQQPPAEPRLPPGVTDLAASLMTQVVGAALKRDGEVRRPQTKGLRCVVILDRCYRSYGPSDAGSSEDDLYKKAQAGTAQFLRAIGDPASVSVLMLGKKRAWYPHKPEVAAEREQLQDHVANSYLDDGGKLHLAEGLRDALSRLRSVSSDEPATIVLVTPARMDESTPDDLDRLIAEVKSAGSRRVHVHVILFHRPGSRGDDTPLASALRRLAQVSGGSFQEVTSDELPGKLAALAGQLNRR